MVGGRRVPAAEPGDRPERRPLRGRMRNGACDASHGAREARGDVPRRRPQASASATGPDHRFLEALRLAVPARSVEVGAHAHPDLVRAQGFPRADVAADADRPADPRGPLPASRADRLLRAVHRPQRRRLRLPEPPFARRRAPHRRALSRLGVDGGDRGDERRRHLHRHRPAADRAPHRPLPLQERRPLLHRGAGVRSRRGVCGCPRRLHRPPRQGWRDALCRAPRRRDDAPAHQRLVPRAPPRPLGAAALPGFGKPRSRPRRTAGARPRRCRRRHLRHRPPPARRRAAGDGAARPAGAGGREPAQERGTRACVRGRGDGRRGAVDVAQRPRHPARRPPATSPRPPAPAAPSI